MTRKKIYGLFLAVMALCLALTGVLLVGCNNDSEPSAEEEYNNRLEPSEELCAKYIPTEDIFHDQSEDFMSPTEPKDTDNVTIRLRVRRGSVKNATLEFTLDLDKIANGAPEWYEIPMKFEIADETMYYDYFICVIPAQVSPYKYHFRLENDVDTVYYNYFESNFVEEGDEQDPINFGSDFYVMPNFKTPDWSKGCLWYSIMPDSFYNGDTLNDKTTSGVYTENPWGLARTSSGLSYFGGDLLGILEKLPYIQQFGTTGVFINPIWLAAHNAGYGSLDMTQIDSAFGNDNMLIRLVDTLHANDMKLMLDGVFTYFSWNGTWYNQSGFFAGGGAANPGDPYYELYVRDSNGTPAQVWGNPRVNFSDKLTRELVYTTPTSVMQYYLRRHGIDGWRLDVGTDLMGTDPGNWETPTQIIQDMRRYLKEIDEDMLLCSEQANGTMLTDYCLDTFWNFNYYYCLQDFLTQPTTENTVFNLNINLYETIQALPKPVANSSYNFTANHDMPRALDASNGDIAKTMAVTLVNMTFTGAPVIHFGDEVGMDKHPFGESMRWDKTEWNYEIYDLYRALSALREELPNAYKDGAVIDLGAPDNSGLLAFARWKGKEKAVTVMNPFDDTRTVTLDVRPLEWKDGTVVYDYLSGRKYTVTDGKVTLSVNRGGVVLVDRDLNRWAGKYEVTQIGERTATVSEEEKDTLILEGTGTLAGTQDAVSFAHLPVYSNGGASAVATLGGSYAIMIRDDLNPNAAFYALVFDGNGKAKVVYRERAGEEVKSGAEIGVTGDQRVGIERFAGNKFAAIVYEGDEKKKAEGTEQVVAMDYAAEAGFVPIGGEGKLKDVSVYLTEESRATAFDAATDSMMFDFGDADNFAVADGALTIKGAEEGVRAKLTQSHMADISVKTLLKSTPAEAGAQGVVIWQSENNYLLAGRGIVDGEVKLVFLQNLYGTSSVFASKENVEGDITIQIEKVGYHYSAKYSTDGEIFTPIGENLLSNYSEIYAGVASTSKNDAVFDYFSFGDAIHDGHSTADHQYYDDIEISSGIPWSQSFDIFQTTSGGFWDYTEGGLKQTSLAAEETTLSFGGTAYNGFKADFTLQITEQGAADGYVEYRFGISDAEDYGSIRLGVDGKVNLYWGNQLLGTYQIENFDFKTQYRFMAVMNEEKKFSLFMNELPRLVIEKTIDGYHAGQHRVVGHKAAFEITSYYIFRYYYDLLSVNGTSSVPAADILTLAATDGIGQMALLATGVSDFIFSANVKMIPQLDTQKAQFGLLLNGCAGSYSDVRGTLVSASDDKTVSVTEKGKVLATTQADFNAASFFLIIVMQNGKLEVYIDKYQDGAENVQTGLENYSTTPVLTYDAQYALGGSIQFFAGYANVTCNKVGIKGLRPDEDYKKLELFTKRVIEVDEVVIPPETDGFAEANEFSWDFEDPSDMRDFTPYVGAWYVDPTEKCLVGLGSGTWDSGITINKGRFSNYELHYKAKVSEGSLGGPILGKNKWDENHEMGAYLFFTGVDNTFVKMHHLSGTVDVEIGSGTAGADGYLEVTIKIYGSGKQKTAKIMINGTEYTQQLDMTAEDGFVGFCAANSVTRYKDISIKKLDESGSAVS